MTSPHKGANILAVVDLDTQVVTAQIPVDGAPAGIALSPDRKTAYVTRPEGHGLAIVDLDARAGRRAGRACPSPRG
ncbi:YncE family protein, partial [Methylobacterium bullatum]|uniref:YncE family protein n=1 Tax=Methylobacterium bullatum TaxID=570505 RepID=UPI00402B1C57